MTIQQKELTRSIECAEEELSDLCDMVEENSIGQAEYMRLCDLLEIILYNIARAQCVLRAQGEENDERKD